MIGFVGAKLYIAFVYGLWFLYTIRCKRCQSRNQKSPVFTSGSKGKQTETILNLELRNRCSTTELHWLESVNKPARFEHPYFGRVNVHGKSIRHLPDTLVVLAVRCKPTAQSKASPSPLRRAGCPSGPPALRMSLPPMQTHAQYIR